MKVIENKLNPPKSWKIVCPDCDSVLEYEKSDVIKKESRFFYLPYIKCPCCGSNIDVNHW